MAVPTAVSMVKGLWEGKSRLNFSEDSEVEKVSESDSLLRVELDRNHMYATVSYTWEFEGVVRDGQIVIAGSEHKDKVSAGWVDSWHQGGSVLSLLGSGMRSDWLRLDGEYADEGYADWGWRIELGLNGDALELRMTNVSPDGEETWAVSATYNRSQ